MAFFVQHLAQDGVIKEIIGKLTKAYLEDGSGKKEQTNLQMEINPEVKEWRIEQEKCVAEKNFHGLFLLCFNKRAKLLQEEQFDGKNKNC